MTARRLLVVTDPPPGPVAAAVVRTALGDLAAWDGLRRSSSLGAVVAAEPGIEPMLPMVDRCLERHRPDDPDRDVLGQLRRTTGFRDRILADHARQVLAELAAAGVSAVVLKGLALARTCYPSPDCRAMADVDLLVPAAAVDPALEVLGADAATRAASFGRYDRATRHSGEVPAPGGVAIDLHWAVHRLLQPPGPPPPPLPTAHLDLGAVEPALTLAPTAHLLHVLVGGLWDRRPRWCLDAALLLRSGSVDLGSLVDHAGARQVAAVAHDGLVVVGRTGGPWAPDEVLDELAGRAEGGRRRRQLRRALSEREGATSTPTALRVRWARESARTTPVGAAALVGPFVANVLRTRREARSAE